MRLNFGITPCDDIRASQVLKDGYGQCNTKSTLLMALLRAVNIHNRATDMALTIYKALQKKEQLLEYGMNYYHQIFYILG